jgi:hypothetical protein
MPDERGKKLGFTMMGVTTGPDTFWDPLGKVFKRLQNGKEDNVYYLYSRIGSKAKPAAK